MMPYKPWVQLISSSTWSCTTAYQSSINHLLPEQFLTIEEALVVDKVPQELDGWLRSLFLDLRHVDIIDKNGDGFIGSCAE